MSLSRAEPESREPIYVGPRQRSVWGRRGRIEHIADKLWCVGKGVRQSLSWRGRGTSGEAKSFHRSGVLRD